MNVRFVVLRVVACILFVHISACITNALPGPNAYADVSAHFGAVNSTNSANGNLAQPADAIATDPFLSSSYAVARAAATTNPGTDEKFLHAYSYVQEASPASGLTMEATSTARSVSQWKVTPDDQIVSPDTNVPLDASLSFDGTLFAINGNTPYAEVKVTMNIYRDTGMTTLFDGAGRLQSSGTGIDVLTSSGDLVNEINTSGNRRAIVHLNDFYENFFTVPVGEVFAVELILTTHAAGDIANGEGSAYSDFYNSGNFSLSIPEGLTGLTLTQINPVPEPEAYAMLMAGLGVVGSWRRDRD